MVVEGLVGTNLKYVQIFKKSTKVSKPKSELSSLPFLFGRKGSMHVSILHEWEAVSFCFHFTTLRQRTLDPNERFKSLQQHLNFVISAISFNQSLSARDNLFPKVPPINAKYSQMRGDTQWLSHVTIRTFQMSLIALFVLCVLSASFLSNTDVAVTLAGSLLANECLFAQRFLARLNANRYPSASKLLARSKCKCEFGPQIWIAHLPAVGCARNEKQTSTFAPKLYLSENDGRKCLYCPGNNYSVRSATWYGT